MTSRKPTQRVLFVEFINDDPMNQHRSEYFPFYQGHLRALGLETEWVSLNAGRELRPSHPFVVEPAPEQCAVLAEAAREIAADAIILNEKASEACHVELLRAVPEALFIEPPHELLRSPRVEMLERALLLRDPETSDDKGSTRCVEVETPDYQRRRLDPDEPCYEHFVKVLLEPHCVYNRSVSRNPFFADVDLDPLRFRGGCTFCTNDATGPGAQKGLQPDERRAAIVEQALRQVRRYYETGHGSLDGPTSHDGAADPHVPSGHGPEPGGRFMLFVAPLLRNVALFFEEILEEALPPSSFFMSARVDEFLGMLDELERWLPRLDAAGHRLAFWQMGLENFSADENLRFNKGVSPAQIEDAVLALRRLEETWPDSFSFWRHGGFGMIVFTPWTRTSDLLTNATEVRRLGLEAHSENLSTRLQLRAGTPLEALAARDDVIIEDPGAPNAFDVVCITEWGEDEIPWRFQNPEVARVHEVFHALFPRDEDDDGVTDPSLRQQIAELRRQGHPVTQRDKEAQVLEALARTAQQAPESSPGQLLLEASRRVLTPEGRAEARSRAGAQRLVTSLRALGRRKHKLLRGFELVEASVAPGRGEGPSVAILLRRGTSSLSLRVEAAGQDGSYFERRGRFGLQHAPGTPVTSTDERALARTVLALAAKVWGAEPGVDPKGTRADSEADSEADA